MHKQFVTPTHTLHSISSVSSKSDLSTSFIVAVPYAIGNVILDQNLTQWGQDEIDNISQTTFSDVFSSMKMFEFRLTFHLSLFVQVQLTILVPIMSWCRPGDKPLSEPMMVSYRCIYASFGLNELMIWMYHNIYCLWQRVSCQFWA